MTNQQYLFERCLEKGDIAKRFVQKAQMLRVRLLHHLEIDELLTLTREIINSPGVLRVLTNIESFNKGKEFRPGIGVTFNIVGFRKNGKLSQPFCLSSRFEPNFVGFNVRTLPIKLDAAHLQYRHQDDRAAETLDFSGDPFIKALMLGILMCRVAEDKFPGEVPFPAVLPLGKGLLLGTMKTKPESSLEHEFLRIICDRHPSARQANFSKIETVHWKPTREIILKTFIGPDQMDASQRKLHDDLSSLIRPEPLEFDSLTSIAITQYIRGINHQSVPLTSKTLSKDKSSPKIIHRRAGELTGRKAAVWHEGNGDEIKAINHITNILQEILVSPSWRIARTHMLERNCRLSELKAS